MNTIQNLFQQAQLAEAAYADFASYPTTAKALEAEGMSTAQATTFTNPASGYSFINYKPNDWTGFSATLFQNTATGAWGAAANDEAATEWRISA